MCTASLSTRLGNTQLVNATGKYSAYEVYYGVYGKKAVMPLTTL